MKKQINQIDPNTINPSSPSAQTIPTQKKPTKHLTVLLLILLVATSATSVFFFYQKQELKKQVTSLEASLQNYPTEVANTSDSTYDSGILTNNYLGIQLEYPDTWTIIDNYEEPKTNFVAGIGTPSNIKIRASRCSFITILKISDVPTQTFEETVRGRQQYVNATEPVKTIVGNTPGYMIEFSEGSGDIQEFIFDSQKQYVAIDFPKDNFHEETIQEILSTLQLIN